MTISILFYSVFVMWIASFIATFILICIPKTRFNSVCWSCLFLMNILSLCLSLINCAK